jgi:hypothetical protein
MSNHLKFRGANVVIFFEPAKEEEEFLLSHHLFDGLRAVEY